MAGLAVDVMGLMERTVLGRVFELGKRIGEINGLGILLVRCFRNGGAELTAN